MPRNTDPKLDPRFRALDAVPDVTLPEFTDRPYGPPSTDLRPIGRFFSALVLLAPGSPLPVVPLRRAVALLGDTYIVEAELGALSILAASPEVVYVEAPRPADIDLVDSVAATKADQNWGRSTPLTGRGVIVGIVDDWLDFTLQDFQDGNGTRVLSLWDQGLSSGSPASAGYGVEYDKKAINSALAQLDPFASVPHYPPSGAHGTHVTGIAVSNGTSTGTHTGVAPDADIIFVRPATHGQPLTSSDRVVEAIKYIFEKAREYGKPAVVNVSLGHNGGRHDGESVVERAIDHLLESKGRSLVKSAGNEGDWQTHTSGRLAAEELGTLRWVFGGGLPGKPAAAAHQRDRTPNTLEIWYSSRDRFRVCVGTPGNLPAWTPDVNPGENHQVTLSGSTVYIESERFHALTGQARIFVRVGPPPGVGFSPGNWLVKLTALEAVDGNFQSWIERDVRDPGNAFADQSFFRFPDRNRTISPPGTIRRGIAVANYDHRATPPAPAQSSSAGPTGDDRPKPEIAAPGTGIISSNAAGHSSGVYRTSKTGTSMSAPHVTGIIAQLFQHDSELTAAQIRAILIASARQPGMFRPVAFDGSWGYGAVDAAQALLLTP